MANVLEQKWKCSAKEAINAKNKKGQTPFHAFMEGIVESDEEVFMKRLKVLLDLGADPNSADNDNKVPLHRICALEDFKNKSKKQVTIAPLLKAFLQICKERNVVIDLEVRDQTDKTPLHYARTPELVEVLSSFGANLQAKSNGFNMLHIAIDRGDRRLAKHLLTKCYFDINEKTEREGDTPMHIAVQRKNKWIIFNVLCPMEARVDIQNNAQLTATDLAHNTQQHSIAVAFGRHVEMISALQKRREKLSKGGVFVFDLEADGLFDSYSSFEEALQLMKMTIAVGYDGKEYITFFGNREDDMKRLGVCFDNAEELVIFFHKSDIGILEKYFINEPNGKERIQSWRNKVVDPSIVIFELDNTYISLGDLSQSNGLGEKYGDSTEAPTLWKEGKVDELTAHCKQDVELLSKIYERGDFLRFTSKDRQTEEVSYEGKNVDIFQKKVSSFQRKEAKQ